MKIKKKPEFSSLNKKVEPNQHDFLPITGQIQVDHPVLRLT